LVLGFSTSLYSQTDQLDALLEAGHFKQVARSIDVTKTSDAETLYLLSNLKQAFGKTDEAVQYAERAVKADPNRAKYHLQLAGALSDQAEKAGFFKKLSFARRIRSELETGVKLEPKNTDCLMGMMMFYQQAPSIVGGSKDKAKQLAKEIGQIDTSKGYLAQAQLVQRNEDKEKLEGFYLSAVKADPKSVEALVALARFYASDAQEKYNQAKTYTKQAMAIDHIRTGPYISQKH
jgi:tetratricopeptide (TPR) repeat protein